MIVCIYEAFHLHCHYWLPGGFCSYSMNICSAIPFFALHGFAIGLMLMLVTSDVVHDIVRCTRWVKLIERIYDYVCTNVLCLHVDVVDVHICTNVHYLYTRDLLLLFYRYRLKHYPNISMTKDVKTPETTLGNEITKDESDKFEIWFPAETGEDMLQEIQY